MQVAAGNMSRLNIPPDEPSEETRGMIRCTICRKFWKTFERDGVKHKKLIDFKGAPEFRFCPLADDYDILARHERARREKETTRNRDKGRKMRERKRKLVANGRRKCVNV